MRVLHVSAYFAPAFVYGGPPRSILGLCQALLRVGVDVCVFTTTANGCAELPPGGDVHEGVPVRRFRTAFPRRFFGVAGLRQALVREGKAFDLLHVHGLWNVPVWTASRWARRAAVPYVLSPRGMLERGSLAHHSLRKRIAHSLFERRTIEGAALLHATSLREARSLEARGEVLFLPNGVAVGEDAPRPREETHRRLGLAPGAPLVVFLGRVHPIKRLDLLIEALPLVRADVPQAQLIVAGPVEDERVRERFGSEAGVNWMGTVEDPAKASLLADASVVVSCSESESFGMSVAEALAEGVPVVVTRSCPWAEVETHGCGFWVEQRKEAIAEGILRVLRDPEDAAEMGRCGRALIAARYDWRAIAEKMADAYSRVQRGK